MRGRAPQLALMLHRLATVAETGRFRRVGSADCAKNTLYEQFFPRRVCPVLSENHIRMYS